MIFLPVESMSSAGTKGKVINKRSMSSGAWSEGLVCGEMAMVPCEKANGVC